MQGDRLSRRSVLTITAGCALTSVGVAATGGPGGDEPTETDAGISRDSFPIMAGTDRETTVYAAVADADGPTVVVVGGVHGNEVAGYVAANEIADWTIDAGTLVTIPEANAVAVERGTRTDDEGVDLNRQFPEGDDPETALARAIWDVVSEYDPDVVVDLHESTGIYAGDPVDGVGQAVFHSEGDDAAETAADATEYATQNYVDEPEYAFQTGSFSGPENDPQGLLVHKAARELGADAFLVETLSTDVDLETRVQWQTVLTEQLTGDELFPEDEPDNGHAPGDPDEPEVPDEPDGDDPDEPDAPDENEPDDPESPIATIRTIPEDADELALEPGQTVDLDGSCSSVPDGEIGRYEWGVGGNGCFDETGETITVTIGANGSHSVVLRVVDDSGRTGTESITLSAGRNREP
ncbi:PKD domain-containing protein [Natronorubrum sp. JWXQ-INN-674]|uniref:PKD domain-containing protein n=1 Tax=Natronorubrum halalkaliphilum TaxID=2691917 RepID=A0A6B0VRY9_9EURY|nr:succinylglutamate desuccinylase/aspartoacylase family protein [Natronorubrum halalkaliphilum]MXV64115.1 PKD domain-containing protein [Natronorubrum halalkaliphilum]